MRGCWPIRSPCLIADIEILFFQSLFSHINPTHRKDRKERYHLFIQCELDASCPVPSLAVSRVNDSNLHCLFVCTIIIVDFNIPECKQSIPEESLVDWLTRDPWPPSQQPMHAAQLKIKLHKYYQGYQSPTIGCLSNNRI